MNLSVVPNSSLLGRMLRLPLGLLPKEAVLPVLQGPLRGTKWIVGSETHGCWLGTYEHDKQRRFFSSLKSNDVVWDIGANVGLYTLLAAKKARTVLAVEPLPDNVSFLRRHLALNRIANVQVIQAAAGGTLGEARFTKGESRSEGHLSDLGDITVEVRTLDSLLIAHSAPSVLKIDVEGGELDLLQGGRLTLQHRPTIFLATHSEILHQECVAYLEQFRYDIELLQADELLARSQSRKDWTP